MFPRVLPVGDLALTLEVGDAIDPALAARVAAVDRALLDRGLDGVRETVPTYRSLLVVYDRRRIEFARLAAILADLARGARAEHAAGRRVEIPVVYDGEDLGELAAHFRLSATEVAARHAAREYRVFMLGFSPGFAYMGELDESIRAPRRATPRTRVPAGSVAVAGPQTGVYPRSLPGGWNLIGRTDVRLFDPFSETPSLLMPGDAVRFVPSNGAGERRADEAAPRRAGGGIEFVEPGFLTTVQDEGRFFRRRLAVPWSGAADRRAARAANRCAGNRDGAPLFEMNGPGARIVFRTAGVAALAGADVDARLLRDDLGAWSPRSEGGGFRFRPGNELRVDAFRSGARAYLAIGGLECATLLGSASVDEGSGLLSRVVAGDCFAASRPTQEPGRATTEPRRDGPLRVIPGPQDDHFATSTIERFFETEWRLGVDSDRVATRLDGPRLPHLGPAEIVTDGMVPGCIQVPPDGRPIVMLRDCPTTGGYPKIGTVVSDDLDAFAQAIPGKTTVRFERADLDRL